MISTGKCVAWSAAGSVPTIVNGYVVPPVVNDPCQAGTLTALAGNWLQRPAQPGVHVGGAVQDDLLPDPVGHRSVEWYSRSSCLAGMASTGQLACRMI